MKPPTTPLTWLLKWKPGSFDQGHYSFIQRITMGTISKQTIQLRTGLKILIHTSPKKTYRWQISTWKDVSHHMSSEKCKYIEILLHTWTLQNIYKTKFWWQFRSKRNLFHCWYKCKMVNYTGECLVVSCKTKHFYYMIQ